MIIFVDSANCRASGNYSFFFSVSMLVRIFGFTVMETVCSVTPTFHVLQGHGLVQMPYKFHVPCYLTYLLS